MEDLSENSVTIYGRQYVNINYIANALQLKTKWRIYPFLNDEKYGFNKIKKLSLITSSGNSVYYYAIRDAENIIKSFTEYDLLRRKEKMSKSISSPAINSDCSTSVTKVSIDNLRKENWTELITRLENLRGLYTAIKNVNDNIDARFNSLERWLVANQSIKAEMLNNDVNVDKILTSPSIKQVDLFTKPIET